MKWLIREPRADEPTSQLTQPNKFLDIWLDISAHGLMKCPLIFYWISSGNLVKGWTSCDEHPLSSLPVDAGEIRSSSLCRSHRELIADSPPSPTPLSFITTRVTTSDDACSIWDAWMTFRYRYVEEERKQKLNRRVLWFLYDFFKSS